MILLREIFDLILEGTVIGMGVVGYLTSELSLFQGVTCTMLSLIYMNTRKLRSDI
jgi:hypothetical protein